MTARRLPPFPRTVFRLGVIGLTLALAALALAGCQQMTLQAGDLRATQTSFLTRNTLVGTCNEFGLDGTPRSSSSISNQSVGDVAMAHEIFAGVNGLAAQLKPVPKVPGLGARQGMTAENGQQAAACLLEHFKGESAPFPPPPPPQQSGQQPSTPHDPGDRPAMLESPEP